MEKYSLLLFWLRIADTMWIPGRKQRRVCHTHG